MILGRRRLNRWVPWLRFDGEGHGRTAFVAAPRGGPTTGEIPNGAALPEIGAPLDGALSV
jgi:hypothetical protein